MKQYILIMVLLVFYSVSFSQQNENNPFSLANIQRQLILQQNSFKSSNLSLQFQARYSVSAARKYNQPFSFRLNLVVPFRKNAVRKKETGLLLESNTIKKKRSSFSVRNLFINKARIYFPAHKIRVDLSRSLLRGKIVITKT